MPDYLYMHIPFCVRKCVYCDFLSVPYNDRLAHSYIDALCKELYKKKDSSGILKSVFIGGGTPSLLSESAFRTLFRCLRNNFVLSPEIEITVEMNPGTMDEDDIIFLLSVGVNRFSVGVQSFNELELKTLGRIHNSSDALRAVESLKRAGANNISIDLMYGIPGQTMETWRKTLSTALSLSPHHLSAYELTAEKGTPLYAALESHVTAMPSEDVVVDMDNYAIDYLTTYGYGHYEISNFALSGCECIHNLNYWNRGEYIGTGAGAHSFSDGVRSKNTEDINRYIESLAGGTIPQAESTRITPQEAVEESLFLGLRKKEGITMKGSAISEATLMLAGRELVDDGFIEISGNYLRLTRKGLMISNTIIVTLFEKLGL